MVKLGIVEPWMSTTLCDAILSSCDRSIENTDMLENILEATEYDSNVATGKKEISRLTSEFLLHDDGVRCVRHYHGHNRYEMAR